MVSNIVNITDMWPVARRISFVALLNLVRVASPARLEKGSLTIIRNPQAVFTHYIRGGHQTRMSHQLVSCTCNKNC